MYLRPALAPAVTLPPFAAFWQANRLLEMPKIRQRAQFVRFADFRRDFDNHPLKTASGKVGSDYYAHCQLWLRGLSRHPILAGAG